MAFEISRITDENLNAAAMIADSKENRGNDDKDLSSKELTAFMQAALTLNCKNEDVLEIVNQVKAAEEDDKNIQKNAVLNKKITVLNNAIKTREAAIASKEFSDNEIKKKKTQGIVNYSLGLVGFLGSGIGIFSGIGAGYAANRISGLLKLSEMATSHITGTALALGLVAVPLLSYLLGNYGGKQINSADKLNEQKSQMQKEVESLKKELEQTQKMLAAA